MAFGYLILRIFLLCKDLYISGTNLSFAQSPPPTILPALADEILTFLFLKKMFWYACMAISAQALLAE